MAADNKIDSTGTIGYRREHPGGGILGRCSFGVSGVNGIVVFDNGLFVDGLKPDSIVLCVRDANGTLQPLKLAEPRLRQAGNVTSAVIAAANVASAMLTGTAIAEPKAVAETANVAASKVVAAATRKA